MINSETRTHNATPKDKELTTGSSANVHSPSLPKVVCIFDIGKTNKKIFLFDEQYEIVFEASERFDKILDEDGDTCENVIKLSNWIVLSLKEILDSKKYKIKAVNFSTYGASFVLLGNREGVSFSHSEQNKKLGDSLNENNSLKTIAPLYNYLKPFPEKIKSAFYEVYGNENKIAVETASPILGNLNSGMQLYLWKKQKPEIFKLIKTALHLPQFVSFLISKQLFSDITSLGCHTALWDFKKNDYHDWVKAEKIDKILAPIVPSTKSYETVFNKIKLNVGVGLHDSSAALIPYLKTFKEPFILISTGTWCISLNPFNRNPLTQNELMQDCLCYLSYEGKPIKAARIFGGNEHEVQTKRIANHFNISQDFYKKLEFEDFSRWIRKNLTVKKEINSITSFFEERDLCIFENEQLAYFQLMDDITDWQFHSTSLIIQDTKVKKIFVDGGFSKNSLYMQFLAKKFHKMNIYASDIAQASALGAALVMHEVWNKKELPLKLISIKKYN